MTYRRSFACLWCGRRHVAADPAAIEGWALLCPDCVGRAGENPFLRFRLRAALAERAAASRPAGTDPGDPVSRSDEPAPGAR